MPTDDERREVADRLREQAEEVDAAGYTDAGEATHGHMEMCEKWSKEGEQE